jgi:hypothetical protein
MHVVCSGMEEHFLNAACKPTCIPTKCKRCGRELYICEVCYKGAFLRECEACVTGKVLFEDQGEYPHKPKFPSPLPAAVVAPTNEGVLQTRRADDVAAIDNPVRPRPRPRPPATPPPFKPAQ